MNEKYQREKLRYQIRDQYGKLVYSYTCHLKEAQILGNRLNYFKSLQIILSGVSTGGILVTLFGKNKASTIFSAFISATLFVLNTYLKNVSLIQDKESHLKTSNELWKVRESYLSLLTDFDVLKLDEIMKQRDELVNRTSKIYDSQLQTSKRAYRQTQKALKSNQEQYFSQEEIDMMLPKCLRIDGECRNFNEPE